MGVSPQSIHILHVDDDPAFSELATKFIERTDERMSVETASSVSEGLDRLRQADFDCVVSDWDMPGQDGLEFLEAVRQDSSDLPFILFTGKGSEEVASEAISAGVTDYLQKESGTSQYEVLANRVENSVNQHSVRRNLDRERIRRSALFENTPDPIMEVEFEDKTPIISDVNPAFEEVFGYEEETVIGRSVTETVVPESEREEHLSLRDEVLLSVPVETEVRRQTHDGVRDFVLRIIPIEATDISDGAYAWYTDVTDRKERERELQETKTQLEATISEKERQNRAFDEFLDIVNDASLSFDERMTEVLDLGVEFLNLDNGIISNIDPPDYTVEHVVTPDGSIEQGAVLDFSDTFCELVYEADDPVSFHSPGAGDVEDHPCYQDLGLQAYLGEPLIVDEVRYGTLNFSSPSTRDEPFTGGERAFIRTISGWVSRELSRQQRERELARYEKVLEEVSDGVYITDPDGRYTYVNSYVEEKTGFSEEELIGATPGKVLPDEAVERFEEAIKEILAGRRETFAAETEARTKDGDWYPVDAKITVLTDDDGHLEGTVGIIRDITERKDREQEFRETAQRLDLAMEATDTGVWEWDLKTDEVVWNEQLERMMGLEPGAFEGSFEALEDYVHPNALPELEQAIEETVEGDGTYSVELRMVRADGEEIWVRGLGEIHTDKGSKRMIGTATDITDRKEREQELEQAHELTEVLSTTLPDYSFIYNEAGDYLDVITGWEGGTMAYSPEELIGQNVEDVLNSETADRIKEAIQTTLDTGELQTVQYRIEAPRGTIWYEASLAPLTGGYKGEPAVVLTARDISERQARQRELQRRNERLEAFAATVSHDLRSPLSVAGGNLQLAIEEDDPELLVVVDRAHERMEALIDDLLTLAKAGDSIGETESVELAPFTEGCWRNVETGSATLVAETVRTIQADETRLRQLLENLFRNAVEHGGRQIRVTVGDLPEGFFIEDDGPGIPEEEQEDALVPGYSTREDGTGFGLSIVRDIAEAHNWEVSVTDGAEGGARFEFTGVEG